MAINTASKFRLYTELVKFDANEDFGFWSAAIKIKVPGMFFVILNIHNVRLEKKSVTSVVVIFTFSRSQIFPTIRIEESS